MIGSRWFTDHPTVPLDRIVAQLNVDMIGRGGAQDLSGAGPGYLQLVGSRRLSTELGDLVEQVNTEGRFGRRLDYQYDANAHPQNIYCRSDHQMYARFGIPVVFFTTGVHRDYHMATDEVQYVDFEQLSTTARFIAAVGRRIADRDARVKVDKPRPDPTAACQQ
jgi:Zn-dependent M28 family amino/carboxypeptidase